MMDPLSVVGVVSNIAQLIDFGGALISKSAQIYHSTEGALVGNVDIELVTDDLCALISNFKSTGPIANEPLRVLSNSCEGVAQELLEILKKLKPKGKHGKWQSIKQAIRSEMKKEGIKSLEDRLSKFRNELNIRITADTRDQVAQLCSNQLAGIANLNHVVRMMLDSLEKIQAEIPTNRNSSRVQREFEATRSLIRSTATYVPINERVLSSIDARFASLHDRLEQLSITSDIKQISSSCRDLLNATSEILAQKNGHMLDEISLLAADPNKARTTDLYKPSPSSPKNGVTLQKRRRRFIRSSSNATWFGKILISSEEEYLGPGRTLVITEVMLLPARWLFRSRIALHILRYQSIVSTERPKYSLQPIEMLPSNSLILSAIAAGDISTATRILSRREVSPFAVTVDGENLLGRVALKLDSLWLDLYLENTIDVLSRRQHHGRWKMPYLDNEGEDAQVKAKEMASSDQDMNRPTKRNPVLETVEEPSYTTKGKIRVWKDQIAGLIELFISLLSQGVDAGHRSNQGHSAISSLLQVVHVGADLYYEDDISFLLNRSFSVAKSNPLHLNRMGSATTLFIQYAHMYLPIEYMGFVKTCLQNEEWSLCSDNGYCSSNAEMLLLLHPNSPEDNEELERWVPLQSVPSEPYLFNQYWHRRKEVMQKLLKNITENFGDECIENADVDRLIYVINGLLQSAMVSLLYASPLKGYDTSKHDLSRVRRYVVQEVISILGFVRRFHMEYVLEDRSWDIFLEWVIEWDVLDVWMDCLRRVGVKVSRKTRKTWALERKNYRYSDLLED